MPPESPCSQGAQLSESKHRTQNVSLGKFRSLTLAVQRGEEGGDKGRGHLKGRTVLDANGYTFKILKKNDFHPGIQCVSVCVCVCVCACAHYLSLGTKVDVKGLQCVPRREGEGSPR